ncbi:hemolysin family protein [Corynebacterium freiburgense]|uniref:hemolysin family protein n=1 Tax=Corynebacterium freiburgense TaxID=556548 RepID=UPI0004143334|nr:hemolysin family protein [Corynebacterium freiburgense]WJZ02582.1 Magnesium and cobalt efflux protein CorC [Corynebacterium freiburgense]
MDIALSIISLLGFIALTAGTGFFVAIEFALTGLERSVIDNHVASHGDAKAKAVQAAHNNLSFELSGAQLGITITTLATGFLAEPILAQYFTPLLEFIGLGQSTAPAVALVLALIVATLLSMVYGELVPKNMAITDPLRTARFTVIPVRIFNRCFGWFIRALNTTANAMVRKIGLEPADELASARSAEELGALVRNSAQHGAITEAQAALLDRSLQFGESTAEDFMTPRSTIEYLSVDDTVTDLLELAQQTGRSRFPVVKGDLDETIGVVHVKAAFGVPRDRRSEVSVATLARPVPVVPHSLDGDAVLNAVRSAGPQIVLVADEYGGTAGLVTIEDVVEEILGEVYDEYDDAEAERDFLQIGASWEISGLARIDDVRERTGYVAPDGPYETFGGLIMATLGRIPVVGDKKLLPQTERDALDEFESGISGRWVARVAIMDGRRIDRAILTPISDEEASEFNE